MSAHRVGMFMVITMVTTGRQVGHLLISPHNFEFAARRGSSIFLAALYERNSALDRRPDGTRGAPPLSPSVVRRRMNSCSLVFIRGFPLHSCLAAASVLLLSASAFAAP